MKHETKLLSLMQRVEVNDLLSQNKIFSACAVACKYGLESLNEVKLNFKNAEDEINKLSIDELTTIGNDIIEASNFPKKK